MRSTSLIFILLALANAVPLEYFVEVVTIVAILTESTDNPLSTSTWPAPGEFSESVSSLTTPTPTGATQDRYLTISVSNIYGTQVSLSLGSNAGAPTPLGNPAPTVLADSASTYYLFPEDWAGRIYVGPDLSPDGSKIEASFIGPPDIDVSFVDGFTVPVTCSAANISVTGCNIDLFRQEDQDCKTQHGPVCLNPARDSPDGPAAPFFAACAGAAYTFPNDNKANVGMLDSSDLWCCIGTACPGPARQQH